LASAPVPERDPVWLQFTAGLVSRAAACAGWGGEKERVIPPSIPKVTGISMKKAFMRKPEGLIMFSDILSKRTLFDNG